MITVRQIEKLINNGSYERLLQDLMSPRPEGSVRIIRQIGSPRIGAAAMGMIRLDELSQSSVSLCPKLLRMVLRAQQPDGGWGDLMTTALCVRALLIDTGSGPAVQQGL